MSDNDTRCLCFLYARFPATSFSYPTFKLKEKAPPFQSHPFWNALSSASGRPLAKLAVVCRHPKFKINEDTTDGILNEALPAFRLTASTLNTSGLIPPDITKNEAISKEWQYFPFPETDEIPACALGASPPRVKAGSVGPSKDAINNTPHLSMRLKMTKEPSPVADSPPSNPGKCPPAKKRKAQPKAPKSLANIDDSSSEDEAPPSKAETAAPKPKKALGSVDEQIEAMIPEIREKLREMMTEKKKQGFCKCYFILSSAHLTRLLLPRLYPPQRDPLQTLTLSAFQGHCTYIPNNMFGPMPPPKEKGELPKEPLVELVRFSAIEYEQVLQPARHVSPLPHKKMHTLCDHTWRADKVREVMGGIEEIRGIMFPDAPIIPNMIPHLMDQVSTARKLYSSLHNDLTNVLRAFFTSVRNYVAMSREEVFRQEFKSTLPTRNCPWTDQHPYPRLQPLQRPQNGPSPSQAVRTLRRRKDNAGPSKSPSKKVVLKEKEPETAGKEDGEVDEDAEGEEEAAVEREHEAPKSSPRKKRQQS
ncbi:hypothetical protein B0H14DRAFT_3507350 [Mycena olivaceomarginata]|nr:hypothetical protein B0H14DRAFT_3507350 [Mycena olivaceomarginata]